MVFVGVVGGMLTSVCICVQRPEDGIGGPSSIIPFLIPLRKGLSLNPKLHF